MSCSRASVNVYVDSSDKEILAGSVIKGRLRIESSSLPIMTVTVYTSLVGFFYSDIGAMSSYWDCYEITDQNRSLQSELISKMKSQLVAHVMRVENLTHAPDGTIHSRYRALMRQLFIKEWKSSFKGDILEIQSYLDVRLQPGTTSIPFEIQIPYHVQWPQFQHPNFGFKYFVRADVNSSFSKSHSQEIVLKVLPLPEYLKQQLQVQTINKSFQIGVWDEESQTARSYFRYASGYDTASHWVPLRFRVSIPKFLDFSKGRNHVFESLKALCELVLVNEDNLSEALTVRKLIIESHSTIDSFGEIESKVTENAITRTSRFDTKLRHIIKVTLLEAHSKLVASSVLSSGEKGVDSTYLINSIELPTHVLPSVIGEPHFSIMHDVIVTSEVKAKTWDNVRQVPTKINMKFPIRIYTNIKF